MALLPLSWTIGISERASEADRGEEVSWLFGIEPEE
jgi:hypothetical protein